MNSPHVEHRLPSNFARPYSTVLTPCILQATPDAMNPDVGPCKCRSFGLDPRRFGREKPWSKQKIPGVTQWILARLWRPDALTVATPEWDRSFAASVTVHPVRSGITAVNSMPSLCSVPIESPSSWQPRSVRLAYLTCTLPGRWTLTVRRFPVDPFFADKAYCDSDWTDFIQKNREIAVVIPQKEEKYDTLLSGNCFCSSVSSRRQPVESFFHWIHCKSGILDASHARSLSGILFHIFSALAFIALLSQFYY